MLAGSVILFYYYCLGIFSFHKVALQGCYVGRYLVSNFVLFKNTHT